MVFSLLVLSVEVCLQCLQYLAAPLHPLCCYAHAEEGTCWKLLASSRTVPGIAWDRHGRVRGRSSAEGCRVTLPAPSRPTLPLPSLCEALMCFSLIQHVQGLGDFPFLTAFSAVMYFNMRLFTVCFYKLQRKPLSQGSDSLTQLR